MASCFTRAGAIICGGRQKRKRCCKCNALTDGVCDFPLHGGAMTCDRPICGECTFSPGPGLDYCPRHASTFRLQGGKPAPSPA